MTNVRTGAMPVPISGEFSPSICGCRRHAAGLERSREAGDYWRGFAAGRKCVSSCPPLWDQASLFSVARANTAPLSLAMRLRLEPTLFGDDTTVPILAKTKTVTGRIWTYVRDDRRFWRDRAAGGPLLRFAGLAAGASRAPSSELRRHPAGRRL